MITITLKEKPEKNYNVKFETPPSVSELVASILVLQEVMENNFDRQTILNKMASVYARLQDLEEVYKK